MKLMVAILFAAAICGGFDTIEATKQMRNECVVGEYSINFIGPCNAGDGVERCQSYCMASYGTQLMAATCQRGNGRPSGLAECLCHLRCGVGEYYGDPRYRTFDGVSFMFNNECEHVAMLTKPHRMIPTQKLTFLNRRRLPGEPLSYPKTVKLQIVDWSLEIVLDLDSLAFKVNGETKSLPYQYEILAKHLRQFISIRKEEADLVPIETSFGLGVDLHIEGKYWHDFIVYLARKEDDFIDSKGVVRDARIKSEQEALGMSWCVSAGDGRTFRETDKDAAERREIFDHCRSTMSARLADLCAPLRSSPLSDCLTAQDVQTAFEQCMEDACMANQFASPLEKESASNNAARGVIEAYAAVCNN